MSGAKTSIAWSTKLTVDVVVVAIAVAFTVLAAQLDFLSPLTRVPGSGMFPTIAGVVFSGFAVVNLVLDVVAARRAMLPAEGDAAAATGASDHATGGADTATAPTAEEGDPRTVLYLLGLFGLFVVVFEWLGAVISSILFGVAAVLILKKDKKDKLLVTLLAVVLAPIILLIIIEVLLRQNLPNGLLDWIL